MAEPLSPECVKLVEALRDFCNRTLAGKSTECDVASALQNTVDTILEKGWDGVVDLQLGDGATKSWENKKRAVLSLLTGHDNDAGPVFSKKAATPKSKKIKWSAIAWDETRRAWVRKDQAGRFEIERALIGEHRGNYVLWLDGERIYVAHLLADVKDAAHRKSDFLSKSV